MHKLAECYELHNVHAYEYIIGIATYSELLFEILRLIYVYAKALASKIVPAQYK